MTTTRSAADDARDLPKEPTAPWILTLSVAVILVWLAVLPWQVAVLPDRVPTHFGAGANVEPLLDALEAGSAAVQGGVKVDAVGGGWVFTAAPPRRPL